MAAEPDSLTVALARAVVEEQAPHELPLFAATSRTFLVSPEAVRPHGADDEALGFGLEVAAVALTPYALAVAKTVVDFLLEQARAAAEDEGKRALRDALRRLLRRVVHRAGDPPAPETKPAALTPEQLERVRAVACREAASLGLTGGRDQLLADAMVGALVR